MSLNIGPGFAYCLLYEEAELLERQRLLPRGELARAPGVDVLAADV
ncbi:MAG: hypothetical protein ACRDNK_10630 [Solirubrobacteraceae bacterium]